MNDEPERSPDARERADGEDAARSGTPMQEPGDAGRGAAMQDAPHAKEPGTPMQDPGDETTGSAMQEAQPEQKTK